MSDTAWAFVEQLLVVSAQEVASVEHPGKQPSEIRWHGIQHCYTRRMNIYQIIQGVDGPSQGPSYSVGALAHYLADRGNTVEILALGNPPPMWTFAVKPRLFQSYWNPTWGRLGFVGRDAITFIRGIGNESVILHGHNLWGIVNLFSLLVRRNSPARIVWSPRGALRKIAWTYRPVIKRLFWLLLQRRALSRTTCFHVTSIMEYEDERRMGFTQPVAIIPNGVDVPPRYA